MTQALPSANEYAKAFREIRQHLTTNHFAMLEYHFKHDRPVTATELAKLVRCKDWRGVNIQYGRIGKMLRMSSPSLHRLPGQQSYAFPAFAQVPRKDGKYPEWIWMMHNNARRAMELRRWFP